MQIVVFKVKRPMTELDIIEVTELSIMLLKIILQGFGMREPIENTDIQNH